MVGQRSDGSFWVVGSPVAMTAQRLALERTQNAACEETWLSLPSREPAPTRRPASSFFSSASSVGKEDKRLRGRRLRLRVSAWSCGSLRAGRPSNRSGRRDRSHVAEDARCAPPPGGPRGRATRSGGPRLSRAPSAHGPAGRAPNGRGATPAASRPLESGSSSGALCGIRWRNGHMSPAQGSGRDMMQEETG